MPESSIGRHWYRHPTDRDVSAERFADFPVIRVDSDTMTSRQSMLDLTEQLANGDPVLMIGTQMLSKGHHFPHVTLVAVVDADALLFSPDFRGEERLLQLLTQVGGRAGRDGTPGEVLIQTRHPDHPLMHHLDKPHHTALPALLSHRSQAGLPPHGARGVIRCDSQDRQEGLGFLSQIRIGVTAPRVHRSSAHCPPRWHDGKIAIARNWSSRQRVAQCWLKSWRISLPRQRLPDILTV